MTAVATADTIDRDFDIYVEFAGNLRVRAKDAHEARAAVDRMPPEAIFAQIKDGLEVGWPRSTQSDA